MDELIKFLEKQGSGRFAVSFLPDQDSGMPWTVMAEFGREAEDSNMAGGAAYGVGNSFEEAFAQLKNEIGIGT